MAAGSAHRLAQQVDDLREDEHAVGGAVVDPVQVVFDRVLEAVGHVVLVDELHARIEAEDRRDDRQVEVALPRGLQIRAERVGEAQHGDGGVGVLVAEVRDVGLGLADVALDRSARRVRAAHLLGEEGRVILLGAVVAGAGLEHQLAHGRGRPARRGEHVHRADDVVLVGARARGDDRVDDQAGVDDRVDLGGVDDPADQRVRVGDLHELRALQRELRRPPVDPDDRLDLGILLECLGKAAAPVGRQAGDEDAA
jgi:hypothetical protein